MTTFDERERAFENKFVHDEEVRFRVRARRNRAVAAWAGTRLGKEGGAVIAYANEIVASALAGSDDAALAQRIADDLSQGGHQVTTAEVRAEMDRQMAAALLQERPA